MSDVPWTITSSKRKSNRKATAPKKRVKRSHDATETHEDTELTRPQQTLTQIAFVANSSSEDDDPVLDFKPSPSKPATDRPARALKRDSTLTQMDFGSNFGSSRRQRASGMQPSMPKSRRKSKKRDSTLTQMDFFNVNMDGATALEEDMLLDSEHVGEAPRPDKMGRSSSAEVSRHSAREALQDGIYEPSEKRRRKQDQEQLPAEKRRRSSRIASATSTPIVNKTHTPSDSIPTSVLANRRAPAGTPRRPLLEIQDSTEFLDVQINESSLPDVTKVPNPMTPTKNVGRIPSSQTPESIRCSTAKRPLQTSSRTFRQPLAELPTNVHTPIRRTGEKKHSPRKRIRKGTSKKSPPRKVCTLKLPSEMLPTLSRKHTTVDSDHDIYSLHATSSATKHDSSPQKSHPDSSKLTTMVSNSSGGPTIKETASSQRRVDESQESLPDITDVLNIYLPATIGHYGEPSSPTRDTPKALQKPISSGSRIGSSASAQNEMLIRREPVNMAPELEHISTDELSDLGSPVANDTQFVRTLQARLSSPIPHMTKNRTQERAKILPRTADQSPVQAREFSRVARPGSANKRSPLPAPRLVQASPVRKPPAVIQGSSSLKGLPSFPTQNRSFENVQISLVPLNDTVEYQQRSSSPTLPPVPSFSASKSARLASIPPPSQVSTQAPSQGYFPTSSAPQTFPFPHDPAVERITIKDSSSYPAHLSQIVQHEDEDHEDERDLNLLEGGDDLDLDPSTLQVEAEDAKTDIVNTAPIVEEDITQTPTQRSRHLGHQSRVRSSTQSSPIVTNATTRSQRNALLEVIALTSSSSPPPANNEKEEVLTNTSPKSSTPKGKPGAAVPQNPDSPQPPSMSSSLYSPSPPRDLKKRYGPLQGFNNDTQSDFTQGGSVTAAYVHRMWDRGDLPKSFVPKPYKVKNFRKEMREMN